VLNDELFGGYPEFWDSDRPFAETRQRLLADLHRTQLQRVDRVNMSCTIEVRVPFLWPDVAALALAHEDPRLFGTVEKQGADAKRPLRMAMRGLLPPYVLERRKTVLSEGAGLRGNNPVSGMFVDLVEHIMSDSQAADIYERFPDWRLNSKEELYYFDIFRRFNFDKYRDAQSRVFANATATLEA
jgi:asparagine synthetase B (glutamine-hydrolysing)